MSIEAMKLALDCLEDIFGKDKIDVGAINALRQAIAEAERQESDDLTIAYMSGVYDGKNKDAPQPEQKPVAWKLMPRDATDSMLKAMDECSTEGYDERLYAGHAASVYTAAWDAAPITPAEQGPTGCACRWDSEGDRVVTCARHEGWLEVIAEWADRAREAEKKLKALAHSVFHAIIAGALFDFMGWLTSRKERIVLSSADEASPAVNAIIDFAKMRGLSLNDAKVQDWNTAPPQRKPDQEPVAMRYDFDGYGWLYIDNGSGSNWKEKIKNAEPLFTVLSQRTWIGLTDEEIKSEAKYFCNGWYSENPERLVLLVKTIQAKLKEKNT